MRAHACAHVIPCASPDFYVECVSPRLEQQPRVLASTSEGRCRCITQLQGALPIVATGARERRARERRGGEMGRRGENLGNKRRKMGRKGKNGM
eukprot:6198404-Pleurochrysis_carterae.AAC.1